MGEGDRVPHSAEGSFVGFDEFIGADIAMKEETDGVVLVLVLAGAFKELSEGFSGFDLHRNDLNGFDKSIEPGKALKIGSWDENF